MHSSTAAFLLALLGTASSSPLTIQPRQADFSGNQQDGLAAGCQSMIVIFARGTTEGGNVGTIAGPPFFQSLATQVGGNLAVQGVEYPADIPGFLAGGDANGSQMMATLTEQAITNCPNSAVIMSGYSQGGQLVHNGAAMMQPDMVAKVAGAVIFGDPRKLLSIKPSHGDHDVFGLEANASSSQSTDRLSRVWMPPRPRLSATTATTSARAATRSAVLT